MQKVIFTLGCPASGKTSWSKEFCEKDTKYVRVSRDDLRHQRGRYWIEKDENLITGQEIACINIALSYGKNVIVDATNLNKKYNEYLKQRILQENPHIDISFEYKDFTDVPLEELIKRDLKRENSVGEKVIRKFYDKHIRVKTEIVRDPNLPKAIICDLDGTLAIHNGRSPYDYNKCDTDLINAPVKDIIEKYTDSYEHIEIIFMSGRDEVCREKTISWLKDNGIRFFQLYMRKRNDRRKDSIVKKELFMENINGKYNVLFVLDDRNQVVDAWRLDLGLPCFQTNYGDF